MAYDEELAGRIRSLLGDRKGVSEKKMFGGARVPGRRQHGDRRERPGRDPRARRSRRVRRARRDDPAEPMEMRGRLMAGWLRLEEAEVADDPRLGEWVERGAAYAGSLPPK